MTIRLNKIVPWGRSLREYELMFNLTRLDQKKSILDCGGGPSSFTAESDAIGGTCRSVDPLYQYSATEIRGRFLETLDDVIAQVDQTPDNWVWNYHRNSADLRRNRIEAMDRFLDHYQQTGSRGHYIVGALPQLPFSEQSHQLCLCSHLLFLYSALLPLEFHLASIYEMLRIAHEVRIFPLLTLERTRSPFVDEVIDSLQIAGFVATEEQVGYELQRGGDHMLRINRGEKSVAE
jgi:hypothetical protein